MTDRNVPAIEFGVNAITIENVNAIATRTATTCLPDSPLYWRKIEAGVQFLDRLLLEDGVIYGVTTGYGDSCTTLVPPELTEDLAVNLTRFHGCGMGTHFSQKETRAIMVSRLASLARGFSGVRPTLLHLLSELINRDVLPRIPQEGSVGASGDLTPLSYLAAAMIGERDGHDGEQATPIRALLERSGLEPIKLRPKEGLAVMNGTAVMTGIACLAYRRAEYLAQLVTRISAMAVISLKGNAFHFDEKLFAVKPHPGQQKIAEWMRFDLSSKDTPRNSSRLQDRYSLRCAPHIIGVLQDALPFLRSFIETELNSTNDNPIIDGEGEHVLHGGHFYGGHIAFAMDSLKTAIANLADLLDRQLALLMDTRYNNGLPPNLSGAIGDRRMINHGFKAIQIGTSAWTAEALKLTMPASVFSRSTECHNQDKVSLGTIAARDCTRILDLTEQVAAAALLSVNQALALRLRQGELTENQLTHSVLDMFNSVTALVPMVTEDQPLEHALRLIANKIFEREWLLYDETS